MSCRTTPAGSAFTTYARLSNGRVISDVATLSLFHYLRSRHQGSDPETRRSYTREDYIGLLDRQRDRTSRLSGISEPRRQSILERIEAARNSEMPDQSTLYALFNLNPTVRERGQGLQRFLNEVARTLEITAEEARTKFNALEDGIDRSRGAGNPSTYTEANIAEARRRLLATETGTVHAMATLIEEMRQLQTSRALSAVQRIEQRTILDSPVTIGSEGIVVSAYGYDRYGRRLEVTIIDDSGEPRNLAYRNVPESILEEEDPIAFWEASILGQSLYMYESQFEADLDSAAGRCSICGQYANNTHSCPVSAANVRVLPYHTRNTRQFITVVSQDENGNERIREVDVSLPAARAMREAYAEAGAVQFDVHQWYSSYTADGRYNSARVSGSLLAYRADDGALTFSTGRLNCSCEAFRNAQTCEHIGYVTQATRNRINPPSRVRRNATPEEREALARERQALLEQAMQLDWSRKEEYFAEAKRNWLNNSEVLYSEDYESFEAVYNRALEKRRENNDNPVIPFEKGTNVLGDYAKRGSGQAFGMEIEYEFPSNMDWSARNTAQAAIGRELHAAGLAASPQQQGYGSSKRNGFRDTHVREDGTSNWSWERDGSVNGGELVTPAMYDEPETWERLEKAVEILRRNGAIPSKKAGAHVHVGTAAYGSDAKPYAELSKLMTQHEDVMFRIAAEPKRGSHRNNSYSSPLADVPVEGFQDIRAAQRWQGGRTRVLNMGGVSETDPNKSHVEFRIFDSTLDAGAMQAQIKLSVAMTNAALRISSEPDASTIRPKEPKGSHAARLKAIGKRRLTGEQLKDDTSTFRSLLDTLFTSKKDKDQLTTLFAQTKWVGGNR
jgi:hypothetical protein